MKEFSKEWKQEQAKFKIENIYNKETLFDTFFREGEIVGVLTDTRYIEYEDNNPDLNEEELQSLKDSIDDRIVYHNGLFHVCEDGESVSFDMLWPSEKASVVSYLIKKMNSLQEFLEDQDEL